MGAMGKMKDKKRIALVNQRYGLEVNGGSEYFTRQLAEHLKGLYEVEVLTTKALDYITWQDYYQEDTEQIHGVTVRRFSVSHPRNVWGMRLYRRLHQYLPMNREYWGKRWVDAQGPCCPGLLQYIETHKEDYEVIIFVTYLYYPAVMGLPLAAERALLIPTAHDEPYIYFPVYNKLFDLAKGIVYLTPEEKAFVESRFPVAQKISCICGTGIEIPEKVDDKIYRDKYGLRQPYVIYVGRVDVEKGCQEMFQIFKAYKKKYPDSPLKLVLMGKSAMDIPPDKDIIYQGFVSEEDKFNGISGAEALWLPSKYESLSIAVLEAMSLGVPVIVNGRCPVLKGHCERSKAGLFYRNEEEAVMELYEMEYGSGRQKMSANAKKYVSENYQWNITVKRIDQMIRQISENIPEREEYNEQD